jgi:hypothetical protein
VSGSLHDAVELEKRGVVTASIVTLPFKEGARDHARAFGMPKLPIVVMTHPIAHLRPEDLRKRTEEIFPQILTALTRPPED